MQRACAVFVLLLAMSAPGATRGASHEPRYKSEFTYDEQLLEKMIRMEAEMDKWETRMNEQLGQLTSLREHIDHLMKTEDSRLELIKEAYVESRNNLTALLSRADSQVQQLIEKIKKETATTPNILFKARRVKNETPSAGEIIVFEDVLYNHGSGYDRSSGVFIAPIGGTYLFTARLLSQSGGSVFFEINVNGSMNSNGALYGHQGHSYASADSVVRLLHGERVIIKSLYLNTIDNGSRLYGALASQSNEFTGVLLHV
ncbi:uncharacterized protein LOC127847501 isoform X3 [Dreissena polymorpha]|uniref:uncharacterized protein LOC127847501 isoform X3 n=1 Tax=Dreissena polymorpha TaxID=45954 RepID=UPI0022648AF6|nr:uncharacterized protein LOC127847501 isoform X3 [Dreissena polymorpha]